MRVLIVASGTRGDVQPSVALGKHLQAAGYTVHIGASTDFEEWIHEHGLGFEPISINMREIMSNEIGQDLIESGKMIQAMSHLRKMLNQHMDTMLNDLLRMSEKHDAFMSGMTTHPFMVLLAEQQNKPYIHYALQPQHPTRAGSNNMVTPFPRANTRLNLLMNVVTTRVMWQTAKDAAWRLCDMLSIPRISGQKHAHDLQKSPTMIAVSRHVTPQQPDYPTHVQVVGFQFLESDPNWQPPDDLAAFLDAGDPPVYIGFGSMASVRSADSLIRMLVEALKAVGVRGVISRGWSQMNTEDLPASIFLLDSAPHDWLFPRMAAVVHHGGAGTTAAGFRAGVPSVIVPHFGDQPYWARRTHELGVGPKMQARPKLNVDNLAHGIRTALDNPTIQQNAAALGEKIRSEDSITQAVRFVEKHFAR